MQLANFLKNSQKGKPVFKIIQEDGNVVVWWGEESPFKGNEAGVGVKKDEPM